MLVLVRQRGPLFEAIIRALKNASIPVAGADRLVLTEHIAVMDLMALADCLLLPDDDLALASVLRSPLFGLSEEQLFVIAWTEAMDHCARAYAPRQATIRYLPQQIVHSMSSLWHRGELAQWDSLRACWTAAWAREISRSTRTGG